MSQEKLSAIESNVTAMRDRLKRGNLITTIVGVIALAAMVGYFVYGYREINSVLNPKTVVDLGQTVIDDNIPMIKKTLQTEVEKGAPVWAESLSNQALESVPQLRETLVDYSIDQTDQLITQTVDLNEEDIDAFIKENRESIQNAITELKTNKEVSSELLSAIETGFNKALKADMQKDAQEVLAYSMTMQDKMKRLKSGKNLDQAEKLERQALMVLRRLQLAELKDVKLTE